MLSVSLTISVWVYSTETVLVLHHGLLKVLLRLLHDPALHLFGTHTLVLVEINSEREEITKYMSCLFSWSFEHLLSLL